MTPNSAGLAPAGQVTTILAAFPRISHSVTTAAPSPSTTLPGGASAATPLAAPTPGQLTFCHSGRAKCHWTHISVTQVTPRVSNSG
uniref:Uncharacterized protein n=1 Tax=Arundo donax TaxID=35708 RepID=A0A0A9FSU2_ARUDO